MPDASNLEFNRVVPTDEPYPDVALLEYAAMGGVLAVSLTGLAVAALTVLLVVRARLPGTRLMAFCMLAMASWWLYSDVYPGGIVNAYGSSGAWFSAAVYSYLGAGFLAGLSHLLWRLAKARRDDEAR